MAANINSLLSFFFSSLFNGLLENTRRFRRQSRATDLLFAFLALKIPDNRVVQVS